MPTFMTHKNKFFRFVILLAFVLAGFAMATAQSQAPVRWRTFVKMTSPTEGTITLRCLLAPGNHVYGLELPAGGPKATVVDFSGCEGLKLQGKLTATPAPETVDDALFGMKLDQWKGNFELKQNFKLTGAAENAKVGIKIVYMSCDDKNCRPPKTETVNAKVPAYKK